MPDLRTVVLSTGLTLFESHVSLWGDDIQRMGSGRWTYVRYNPDQPEHCEIDKDRLATEFGLLYNGKQRILIPKEASDEWFKSTGTGPDAPQPPAASPPRETASAPEGLVADLSRLADLRAAGTLSDAEFTEAKARVLGQPKPE
jgi:hypothetical protein